MNRLQKINTSGTVEMQQEVAELIVECLNLDITPDEIEPDAPLYGEGLGLDSIDILEIAMTVSKRYGLELRADGKSERHIFSSLRNLTEHIASRRAC